jgi:hypothetical protein
MSAPLSVANACDDAPPLHSVDVLAWYNWQCDDARDVLIEVVPVERKLPDCSTLCVTAQAVLDAPVTEERRCERRASWRRPLPRRAASS